MGRAESPLDPAASEVARFAAELRELRRRAGMPSYRTLEAKVHFSRTTLARATAGQVMPSLEVALALATALGGDRAHWQDRWCQMRAALQVGQEAAPLVIASARPHEDAVDGADPDAAGLSLLAVVAHARKVSMLGRHRILGHVELRYAAAAHAAWARFVGYHSLDHTAHRRSVDILLELVREPDGATMRYRDEYFFDVHWTDLSLTNGRVLQARAAVFFDDRLVAEGATDAMQLE